MAVNDRYPTDVSDPVKRLAERVRELERQVSELQGARPLQHTAITGGALKVIDPLTGDAVIVGLVRRDDEGDKYGVMIADTGGIRFEVNSGDGFRQPQFALPVAPQKALGAGNFVSTTSATFESVYRTLTTTTHKGITFRCAVVTAASTVAEVRIRHGGGTTSGVISCPAGDQTDAEFQWLHGQLLGSGPHQFELQARRVSGAGSVSIFWPELVAMMTPAFCTPDGLPPFP